MARPRPTWLYHFTHINHLSSIAAEGLFADSFASRSGLVTTQVGQPGIKARRRQREVPGGVGGTVGDYVPFYYAPRSPMLFSIRGGQVAGYTEGQGPLVYLITSVERLLELALEPVFTDRNAVLDIARFSSDPADLDALVDWGLMRARMWANTADDPDRRERRMAESLVHRRVPWEAFVELRTIDQDRRQQVETILADVGHPLPVRSHPEAYF